MKGRKVSGEGSKSVNILEEKNKKKRNYYIDYIYRMKEALQTSTWLSGGGRRWCLHGKRL